MLAITAARIPMNTCIFLNIVKDCDEEKVIPTYLLSETR